MIKVGIIGGAGYTAGELLRLLLHHPAVEISFVQSNSQAGLALSNVHQDLVGETNLCFTSGFDFNVDVLFLCMGHGRSAEYLKKHPILSSVKIIDLSHDFRLKAHAYQSDRSFIYGLPELQRAAIQEAENIANPGCFATAIQLALLPLAANDLLQDELHVHAITGATGAGQAPSSTTHFSWRDNNLSVYKAFNHQHLGEIEESLNILQKNFSQEINFIPMRGNFSRGIFASAYINCSLSMEEAKDLYQEFYQQAAFTHLSEQPIHLKQVVNTNKALLHLEVHKGKLLVCCALDNLLKGASGQAIQNMNLMFGLPEKAGLQLKANLF
ncbi:N-acetyl-gamma-glutamyl-phosphate reductase [Xanthovirga aplysinae]|uniref:N-acetyl-gamma-glutamyl-phosphate reductase n=1 Tax=Xanthovirga aplysinae TaxID=2529853 RepID=UPI0012BD4E14|nr:N-acetyl-gamma-glutamyl-phosphate reductase [Xanthovirga aplysinae]MTI32734.1 N-acetyl-gamma-glutamyl-phosphate reductase [Xanthovirga aplysinae]